MSPGSKGCSNECILHYYVADPTLLVWNTSLFYDDVNACYHAPHMKGGDIILVYGKKVYFIQCSVARYDNVLKKKTVSWMLLNRGGLRFSLRHMI